ncbi:HP12 protein homolog, putative [Plasmodium vinckei]|uniref:HP12 protein homolog, putative n=1 Tax=Plasmodium vinckei TaxID=5860 RepID=A0A6V7T3E7_PLAVN|nr:HP12 protein homolog, putative [Plasmodium vinckei]
MTICSGCGITTGANICCPVCLKHNKEAFYCSQECFEKNYNEHKNIHYFIKLTNNDDLHKKNIYENGGSPNSSSNPNLSVIILDDEIEKDKLNGNIKTNNYFFKKKKIDGSTMDGEGMDMVMEDLNNEMLNIENIGKKNDMHIFQENIGNSNFFSRETNLSSGQNEGENGFNNIEYNQAAKNLMFENYQRKKNYHKYNNVKNYYLFDDTADNKSKEIHENENIDKAKFNKFFLKNNKISTYINRIVNYISSYKYNVILPYYQDMQNKDDKINPKNNSKIRTKLTEQKIMELKKQLRTKKTFKIIVLFVIISVIVTLSTCLFSYILETSQKTVLKNSENRLNPKNNKDLEIAELKSYIRAIEDLRQEVYEMKEILYAHNVQLNKHFHINSSYSIFDNFSKMKPTIQVAHTKRATDKLNSLTSHSFYDNNLINSNIIYENDPANPKKNIDEQIPLVQHQYDVNAIHELKHSNNYRQNPDIMYEQNNSTIPEEIQSFNAHHTQHVGNFEETDQAQNYLHAIHPEKEHIQYIPNKEPMETSGYINRVDDINIIESQHNKPNLVTNHNINTEFEQATEIRPIINEENSASKIDIVHDSSYANENENIIYNHDIKEKHKKNSFQIDENENHENNDRKNNINKPNKKKQNTI